MHNVMLGIFNLGGGELLLILFVLLLMAAGVGAVVLIVLWLVARQNRLAHAVPPVQPPSPNPPRIPRTCPRCGAPLPADAPEGLCPRCVLGVGLATHTEASGQFGPHGTQVLQPPPPPAEIAKHFPQLEILECLGRGGMGMVYKARQLKLNRLVALKILAPEKGADPRFAERFLREAQALARLSHPNIVAVHDFGESDGFYYLLMEYVDGLTLRQLLQAHRVLPEEALRIVPKICEALQFAHEQGIVHRDIKPENVLLDKQGTVKIADFGIAKLVGTEAARPALTEELSVLGTPHYMAPEQVEKPQLVDHRADIYSLGVVFYEMLTGELPLGRFLPPSQKVQVDVRLDEVVLHALAKEPERRYQHASEVKTDLETIAASPKPSPASGKTSQTAPPVHIKRWGDFWPWDSAYYSLFLIVPPVVIGLLLPVLLPWWGLKALWLFALEVPGAGFAVMYAVIGSRIRRLKATLPRPTGEVADCLLFRRPFQSPGLAVLHEDRLELIPIASTPITVPLEDIVAVSEVRWFNGTRLWFKKGFVMELADGQRVGVAVAEAFARRWRSRLSKGALPELEPEAPSVAAGPATGPVIAPARLSRTALCGAIWAPCFLIVGMLFFMVRPVAVHAGDVPPGPQWWQIILSFTLLPLGVTAPFGTTLLGGIAISQIRRSAGRLYGLRLAVFDALLYPLLALDALILAAGIFGLRYSVSRALAPGETVHFWASYWWFWLAMFGLIVVADGLIIHAVWRSARRPFARPGTSAAAFASGAAAPTRTGGTWMTAVAVSLAGVLILALAAGAFALALYLPHRSRQLQVNPQAVVRVEEKLRQEIERRLNQAGWRVDGISVSVSPDLRHAECRFGDAWKNNTREIPFNARISLARQGGSWWLVSGEGRFGFLHFSVDTSAQMGGGDSVQGPRSRFPKVAHIGKNNYSAVLHHDDVDLHYALFYAGNSDSSSRDSHNAGNDTWTDDGALTLKNGRSFGYSRESADPDRLRINGREFDLQQGRVFTLHDDGEVTQLALFPSLAVTSDPEQLAGLIATAHQPKQVPHYPLQAESLPEGNRARAVALFNDIEDFGHEFDAASTAKDLAAAKTGTRRLLTLLTNFNAAARGTGYGFSPSLFDDISKVRDALDEGDWDKVREAGRFNEEHNREFRRIRNWAVQMTQPPGVSLSFGPVITRVIQSRNTRTNGFLELGAVELLTPPPYIQSLFEESYTTRRSWEDKEGGPDPRAMRMRDWLHTTGANLMAGDGPPGSERLEMREGAAIQPPWTGSGGIGARVGFDEADPAVVSRQAKVFLEPLLTNSVISIRQLEPGFDPQSNTRQDTFLFQTKRGATGVLQILNAESNPPGVRVRYKLLQVTRP